MIPAPTPTLDLRDIHVPVASWWPLAPGWWVLGCALALTLLLALRWLRRRRRRRYLLATMQAELQRLAEAHANHADNARLAANVSQLLRRVVKARGGAVHIDGAAWRHELERIGRGPLPAPLLAVAAGVGFQRQAELDGEALLQACRHWLQQVGRQADA